MYNNISVTAAPILALSACYLYDGRIDLYPTVHQLDNGYTVASNPVFEKVKDVGIIKDTSFYITSAGDLFDIFKDYSQTIGMFDAVIYTSLLASNNRYLTVQNSNLYATQTLADSSEYFRIIKNDDGTISILDYNQKYATMGLTLPYNITFETEYAPDLYNQQKFNYYYTNDEIYIISQMTNTQSYGPGVIQRFWGVSPSSKQIRGIGVVGDDDYSIENSYRFKLTNLYLTSLTTGMLIGIQWVKYYNDMVNTSNNKNTEIKNSIDSVKQQYLISLPYQTQIVSDFDNVLKVGELKIDIANLKSVETPEYEFTTAPYISSSTPVVVEDNNSIKRRDYEKIFTSDGYDTLFLGFKGNTKEMVFQKDKVTYFHYPKSAQQLALSASGLIESGAVPGGSPIRADKIWKKLGNYSKNTFWGNSLQQENGTFLCSWLSGSDTNDLTIRPVWMDRWYNPGYATIVAAGTATTTVYTEHNPIVWDVESSLTFDPGVWYKYYHKGEKGNDYIISTLSGYGGLRLHLEDWAEITNDRSDYNNDGYLKNYDELMINNSVLNLDGIDQYCLVPYSSTYNLTGDLTMSVKINAPDWNNIKSKQIVGNYFRGGIGVFYNNGINTIFNTIYDKTYGHVMFENNNGQFFVDKIIPYTYGSPNGIVIDNNNFAWVIDNSTNKILYKLDFNGDFLESVNFNADSNLKGLVLDQFNKLYVLDNNSVSCVNTQSLQFVSSVVLNPYLYYPLNDVNVVDESYYKKYLETLFYVQKGYLNYVVSDSTATTMDQYGYPSGAIFFNGSSSIKSTIFLSQIYFYPTPQYWPEKASFSYWFTVNDDTVNDSIYSTTIYGDSVGDDSDVPTHYNGDAIVLGETTKKLSVTRREDTYLIEGIYDTVTLSSTETILPSTWYHVVENWDRTAGVASLYLNGTFQNSSTLGMSISNYYHRTTFLRLGLYKESMASNLVNHCGNISDFIVFRDKTLSEAEIQALYNNTAILTVSSDAGSTYNNNVSIDVDLNNTVRVFNVDNVCIDNENNTWKISGGEIYRNGTVIVPGITALDIACNKDNQIWYIDTTASLNKINVWGTSLISTSLNSLPLTAASIALTNEYDGYEFNDFVYVLHNNNQQVYKFDTNGILMKTTKISDGIDWNSYTSHKTKYMDFDSDGDSTGYDWARKFDYLIKPYPRIESKFQLGTTQNVSSIALSYPTSGMINNEWYHCITQYNATSGILNFYVNGILRDSQNVTINTPIYYDLENSLLIGSAMGHNNPLDVDLNITESNYFKGQINDLRIYNSALNNSDINHLFMNDKEFQDLKWNMLVGNQNFIEEIERFFKHKLPGMKSNFYNIRLIGLQISNLEIRNMIEDIIRDTVKKIAPAYTELYTIVWE